ncbi:hypothetical protein M404DRAFT_1001183 [Pisolithus tinctorius Marx 270]|uniref:Uncharacterized protein n=1 Tax=Pisolithus tinctorius Marx 270 TaxID=870435 RepID=A0A0C3K2D8_PISTI|nr:hypothetical protein M404DRAFT_1001183 [Pisolithus tinctorius Marx 270]
MEKAWTTARKLETSPFSVQVDVPTYFALQPLSLHRSPRACDLKISSFFAKDQAVWTLSDGSGHFL